MIDYIKTLMAEINQRFDMQRTWEGLPSRFRALVEELDRLDPRDFLPVGRAEFVNLRRRLRNYLGVRQDEWDYVRQNAWEECDRNVGKLPELLSRLELQEDHGDWSAHGASGNNQMANGIIQDTKKLLTQTAEGLNSYIGAEVRSRSREFPFVRDVPLRGIIERDYRELTLKLFPSESWKSVVILAGSILEGLLHDLLTRDGTRVAAAMASGRAPNRPRHVPPPRKRDLQSDATEDQWMLNDYIEVADDLTLLPSGWKASVQVVLRDFRNYVHPRKELKAGDPITQGEAFQSVGALMRICDHIQANHP